MNIAPPQKIKTPPRATADKSRSIALAERGISTTQEYCALLSAIMADVLNGDITPREANAMTNAVGQFLKQLRASLQGE
jgi:hypothetical protein